MPQFLRKVTKGRWLTSPEMQADADALPEVFGDLRTDNRRLSVYAMDTDVAVSQIICSLAANCEDIDRASYVAISAELLEKYGLEAVACPGNTACAEVNRVHFDIVGFSARTLCNLACELVWSADPISHSKGQVKAELQRLFSQGKLDLARLPDKVRKRLV